MALTMKRNYGPYVKYIIFPLYSIFQMKQESVSCLVLCMVALIQVVICGQNYLDGNSPGSM